MLSTVVDLLTTFICLGSVPDAPIRRANAKSITRMLLTALHCQVHCNSTANAACPLRQVNRSTSQVDCQVTGLALDELELASLRGTVQDAALHVNFDTRMGRGNLKVAGPRFSGLQARPVLHVCCCCELCPAYSAHAGANGKQIVEPLRIAVCYCGSSPSGVSPDAS